MSGAARSVLVFAAYMLLLGAALALAPNFCLGVFGLPATHEPWIRLLGVLVLCLAFYYRQAARHEWSAFIRATVPARLFVVASIVSLVSAGLAPAVLLGFAAVDLTGAAWTGWACRSVVATPASDRRPPVHDSHQGDT